MSAFLAADCSNSFTTPPCTPRRLVDHEAYFPPRSHLVGLGLNFDLPSQSRVIGLEQCSAPRLGAFSSPSEMRCASYWSSDTSASSRSVATSITHSSQGANEQDDTASTCASSNFAYSPFAGAASPSPRESDDSLSSQVFGLGLALDLDDEDEDEDNESQQAFSYAFQCLASSFESASAPSSSSSSASHSPMFGFAPAPSYSYALSHPTFALLPSANIKSVVSVAPISSSFIDQDNVGIPADCPLSGPSKAENENATGTDPVSDPCKQMNGNNINMNGENGGGERKRKRKESSIFGTPSRKIVPGSNQKKEESENVKRLKASPALKNLSIFTHAAMMEERDQVEKSTRTVDAFAGLCVGVTGSQHSASNSPSVSPSLHSITFEESPELASSLSPSSPSLSQSTSLSSASPSSSRTVDCTLLVSSIPSESPYPPTPSSSAFAPFLYSSTIESLESPSSTTFKEEIKKDIVKKLALGGFGMTAADVNVFDAVASNGMMNGAGSANMSAIPRTPASTGGLSCAGSTKSPRFQAGSERRGMVVVVHTA